MLCDIFSLGGTSSRESNSFGERRLGRTKNVLYTFWYSRGQKTIWVFIATQSRAPSRAARATATDDLATIRDEEQVGAAAVGGGYKSDWSADNSNFIVCAPPGTRFRPQRGQRRREIIVIIITSGDYYASELGRIIWMRHKNKLGKDLDENQLLLHSRSTVYVQLSSDYLYYGYKGRRR